jgi:hypothetical protein
MSKKIFYTRVVEKYFFDIVSLYTIFYAVIYALFSNYILIIIYKVYVTTTIDIIYYIFINS